MEWGDLLAAIALYLVIEGIVPFLTPGGWRRGVEQVRNLGDRQLRAFGLTMMIIGVALLVMVRSTG